MGRPGGEFQPCVCLVHNRLRQQQLTQIKSKTFEIGFDLPDAPPQHVVGQHSGDGHHQTGGGHQQGLAHRARYFVNRDLAGTRHAGQRMVNTPNRAQQADKGRGGAHRGQQNLAKLQLAQTCVQGVAQHTGELLRRATSGGQRALRGRTGGLQQRPHQRLAVKGLELGQRGVQTGGLPKSSGTARHVRTNAT